MKSPEQQRPEIPLGVEAHRWAGQFAAEQTTMEKSKQVYLNTLAVYAVHRYLRWLGIETNLNHSDCWDPILRHRWNVADLVIPDRGTLECRPILPGETTAFLPPEVTEDCMGYLAIQFGDRLDSVQLLGFAKPTAANILDIRQLRSLDDLIDELSPPVKSPVDLEKWLQKVFDEAWHAVEDVLTPKQLAFRSSALKDERLERAKTIELGLLVDRQQVALVVSVWLEDNQEVGILFQVHPVGENEFLPPGLKLKVALESDSEEVEARNADNAIQLALTETPGKPIAVQVSLEDESVTEEFVA